jgi:maltooligosyltrehalose trehalohydrolase
MRLDQTLLKAVPRRRLPVGAEVQLGGGVHFRVWAPRARRIEVVVEGGPGGACATRLGPEGGGYFFGTVEDAAAGTRYRYRLDGEDQRYPDPASRFQPEGPHGPSEVVDPGRFSWTDGDWTGVSLQGQILYEMHVGTFTREGTWDGARRELSELARTGVTVIQVMPVTDFAGRFGWGYDGVNLYAPTRLYGRPDDFRRFVDDAHRLGLGVILDVVYNHLGAEGCYLRPFSEHYFSRRHTTEWGNALNFDDEEAGPVRELVVANAAYWIDEFHLDGLRLDATQDVHDDSPEHVLAALARRAREAAGDRSILLVAENEPQDTRLVTAPEDGGHGLDALYNDDFHHTAMVALTGRREAYYTDYLGTPQELVSAVKRGFLYQGQRYSWQGDRRGAPALSIPPARFVTFLENHDQVANSLDGRRVHLLTTPGRYRAVTALWLLAPGTPLMFQGQEFAASSPFLYFADLQPELRDTMRRGRARFMKQFPSLGWAELPDPSDPRTFERSILNQSEREQHAEAVHLHRDLLRLRRNDPVFRAQRPDGLDGAVLGPAAFVLRLFGREHGDRLVLINLGRDFPLELLPEPLLAPPAGAHWELVWSSEEPRYGGSGAGAADPDRGGTVPGECALVFRSRPGSARDPMAPPLRQGPGSDG